MRALLREVLEISGKINDDIEKKKKKKKKENARQNS
jgi:hypothetical protein